MSDALRKALAELVRLSKRLGTEEELPEWNAAWAAAEQALSLPQQAEPPVDKSAELQGKPVDKSANLQGAAQQPEVVPPPREIEDDDLPGALQAAIGVAEQRWPHTMDARVWAEEFCKLNTASDMGMMIGWFANAIMAGYDTAQMRAARPPDRTTPP